MKHFVMWWFPKEHQPTLDEALARLDDLRENGASERAFGWAELRANFDLENKSCGVAA